MPSSSIPNYLYKRNHVWWFRKRFVANGNVIEYRLSLQTSRLDQARVFALRLQTLCLQMVDSLRGPKNEKNSTMDKTVQEQIKASLRAKIAEWTAEETERWFSGTKRSEGDLNRYIETLDMLLSDLKERIAYDDKPFQHQAEANTILDELPHLKASLNQSDLQFIARQVSQAKVKSLQETRAIILGGVSEMTAPFLSTDIAPYSVQEDSPTLSELFEKYNEENIAKKLARRTEKKYDWYRALIISFFGDVPVHTITGAMGRQFYESLSKLPKGLQKNLLLPAMLSELIAKNHSESICLATASGHHGKINQFFDWVVDKKYISVSPFPSKGIPMPKKNHKDDRQAITEAEAKRVFSHPLFVSHKGVKTKLVQHPHHYFLPLICLFTGMRAGEVAQLYIDDIEYAGNVACIHVGKRHNDQWLKTPNAKRYIPVHDDLIQLGFLKFIADLKERVGEGSRLFPNIPLITDSYSAKPSEWFISNFRDKQNEPTHVTLHGFRHMFRDKLVNLTDSDERICRLMGHKTSNYGSSLLADQQVMQALVNSVDVKSIVSMVKPYTSLAMFHQLNGRA
ncbi:hypothetical protein FJP64_12380 [Kosakonia cowanii]|jgi:integrase|uniref:site-specific integrase n=1 Tax=Kosakonia cowanii TaxID=208223 RepID=UPI00111E1010|nr:site-specific integrase [Kosakonia cowanii]TPD65058.1 hypothetical protein FJP70_12360 [Kosakonia cowanii]TPD89244.1 hypothetical protein FJP67_12370 [Kosakonia cowanii]TPE05686.1 hypothetical protein FJP64_12380 [Kosakonia cowanii]